MEEMEKEPAPTEQSAGNAAAAEQLTSAAEESQPKEDTEKIPEPTDIAEDKEKTEDAERPTHIEKDSSPPEQDLAKEVDDLVPGSAENSAEERDLLGHSAEERELQARDVSFGSETFDEDFLIMDEVQGDDDEESLTKATESTPPGSMENLSTSAGADEDSSKAGEKSDTEKTEETTEKAKDTEMQESAEAMPMQEATEDTPAQHATEATPAQHATEGATAQEATEVTAAQAAAEDTPVQEAGEVQAEDDDDDVVIEELQPPPPSEPVVISMTDDEEEEVPPQGDAQMEDAKGNVATEASVEATGPEKFDRETTEEGVDEDSLATENSDLGKARETSAQDADNESTQSSKEVPVANGSDESREDKSLGEKAAAECNGTASLLKRPLSPDAWKGGDSEATKKVKCEVVTAGTVETGGAGDKKFVVMTRGELEKYVNMRVQESLAKQEQTMLQPMEKKCDTLHRALERWRRRSFQLQKQLNEFVCEQEKCAGARKGRVTQRSVGVCVRMPPLRSAPPPAPVVRTNVVTSGSIVSSSPASASPAQVARANINASTVVTTSGTSAPVPLQLIANTSSPTSQVKSVSLPCTTGSSTVVRTVAMVPSSTAVVTTSAGVKVIDLTQEEDANLARLVAGSTASGRSILTNKPTFAVSSAAGGTVQKITVPSSAIPMLSAAPTTLVQVSPALSRNTTTTQVVGTPNTPTSTGAIRISHPVMTPQRVTYLLPNLSPNVVMNQREGAPRLASSTVSMPTILLRMTTPPNNLVPGSTISMSSLTTQPGSGGNLMVAPPGTQVRMIRAPTPVALQKGGNTFTLPPGTTVVRAPVTIPSAMGTTVVTTKADQSLPPTPRVVVSGTVPPAADASLAKHPAPLPPMPRYLDDPKKKRLPPKPALKITKAASERPAKGSPKKKATARNMDQLLAQWQAYLNTGEEETKTRVGRRPVDLPLRVACNCRLGTCRYGTLSTAFKEKIYTEFRRYGPQMQSRTLLKRMYANGLKRKMRRAAQRGKGGKVDGRKARCKWHYYLPSETPGQIRRKVCKAAFMAVHGVSEKRVRETQLLWLKEKNKKRPPSDSEEESSAPDEQVGEDEDSAEDTEKDDNEELGNGGADDDNAEATDVAPEAEGQNDDDDDDDEVPFIDSSALEPICNLEEEAESLVLTLSPGAFEEDGEAAQS